MFERSNDGDWVDSCTALVEHFDGRLEVLHWLDRHGTGARQPQRVKGQAAEDAVELSGR